jgi:hypothetical protein
MGSGVPSIVSGHGPLRRVFDIPSPAEEKIETSDTAVRIR